MEVLAGLELIVGSSWVTKAAEQIWGGIAEDGAGRPSHGA